MKQVAVQAGFSERERERERERTKAARIVCGFGLHSASTFSTGNCFEAERTRARARERERERERERRGRVILRDDRLSARLIRFNGMRVLGLI